MNTFEASSICEFICDNILERIATILIENRINPFVLLYNCGNIKDIFQKISDEILTSKYSKHQIICPVKSCEPVA